jgi:hypothetical protein
MKAAVSALPAFLATVFGVCTYVGYVQSWVPAVAILCGVAAWVIGGALLPQRPVIAARLICFWILCGVGCMAYATATLVWLALHIDAAFPNLDAATIKEVATTITGAATTLAGVALTKDMESGTGYFWPGTLFKKRVQKVFGSGPGAPPGDTRNWDAVFEDRVRGDGPRGWGCRACILRAKILEQGMRSQRQ